MKSNSFSSSGMIYLKICYDHRFFLVEKVNKLLIGPKQFFFLSLPVEKENNRFSSQITSQNIIPGNMKKTVVSYLLFTPSSIYSCSIGHISEHEFCHLGCWAVLWKISETTKILLKYATFEGGFFNFLRAKNN